MATIKEMVENMYYPTLAEKAAYWDGANAVLEEIEKCSSYEAFCQARRMEFIPNEHFWKLHQIREKIKELKGE